MKYFIVFIVLISFASIIYGFNIDEENVTLAHKFIGGGTIGLFLIAMPLFLFKESRGKNMKDYMLNEENIRKMNAREKQKPDNQ